MYNLIYTYRIKQHMDALKEMFWWDSASTVQNTHDINVMKENITLALGCVYLLWNIWYQDHWIDFVQHGADLIFNL